MKYCIFIFLVFTQIVKAQTLTKNNSFKGYTPIYFLKYYHEEEPDKIIFSRAIGRSVAEDGSFCLIDYEMAGIQKESYNSCFDKTGMPIYFGNDKELTKIYQDSIRLNFKGKDTTVLIDANELRNPTNLWFWKYMPKIKETVVVGGIRKNFITNTIDLVNVSYTYVGKEKLKILGIISTYYLVRSVPLNGSNGVYDERWYDKKGILVKEKHVVGKDGVRIAELSKIVKQ